MGQKTNPIGLRLGIIKGWDSNWYGGKNFKDKLVEDDKIRKYLNARLSKAGISKIYIDFNKWLISISMATLYIFESNGLLQRQNEIFDHFCSYCRAPGVGVQHIYQQEETVCIRNRVIAHTQQVMFEKRSIEQGQGVAGIGYFGGAIAAGQVAGKGFVEWQISHIVLCSQFFYCQTVLRRKPAGRVIEIFADGQQRQQGYFRAGFLLQPHDDMREIVMKPGKVGMLRKFHLFYQASGVCFMEHGIGIIGADHNGHDVRIALDDGIQPLPHIPGQVRIDPGIDHCIAPGFQVAPEHVHITGAGRSAGDAVAHTDDNLFIRICGPVLYKPGRVQGRRLLEGMGNVYDITCQTQSADYQNSDNFFHIFCPFKGLLPFMIPRIVPYYPG